MVLSGDLSESSVRTAMSGRSVRVYPALLSTEADAMAWARSGARTGSVVVADYQASPRGRGGWPWSVEPGRGLGFSVVFRPDLSSSREGWGYVAASVALAEVLADGDTVLEWPDFVDHAKTGDRLAALGVYVHLGADTVEWIVVTVLVVGATPPRAQLLASCVEAIETRMHADAGGVLDDYRARCATLHRTVRARLVPLGPGGPQVSGQAVDVLSDGALVLLTARGNRVAVPPHSLGLLEEAQTDFDDPAGEELSGSGDGRG
ncbi:MAG: hypothetical protein H0T14_06650 [Nocardioidaceae bacterium]|nr:hypothetical protein [Nocardioidaceae bacterium]